MFQREGDCWTRRPHWGTNPTQQSPSQATRQVSSRNKRPNTPRHRSRSVLRYHFTLHDLLLRDVILRQCIDSHFALAAAVVPHLVIDDSPHVTPGPAVAPHLDSVDIVHAIPPHPQEALVHGLPADVMAGDLAPVYKVGELLRRPDSVGCLLA